MRSCTPQVPYRNFRNQYAIPSTSSQHTQAPGGRDQIASRRGSNHWWWLWNFRLWKHVASAIQTPRRCQISPRIKPEAQPVPKPLRPLLVSRRLTGTGVLDMNSNAHPHPLISHSHSPPPPPRPFPRTPGPAFRPPTPSLPPHRHHHRALGPGGSRSGQRDGGGDPGGADGGHPVPRGHQRLPRAKSEDPDRRYGTVRHRASGTDTKWKDAQRRR